MLNFIERIFLARGLNISATGFGLCARDKDGLDAMLACGVPWRRLRKTLATAYRTAPKAPSPQHAHAFGALLHDARWLLGNQLGHDVRNAIDFQLYIQELRALNENDIRVPGKVVEMVMSAMQALQPAMTILWSKETALEEERRATIERAGLKYRRHMYPDYTGCDELFYDGPFGPDDPELVLAKEILARSA